jgi:hypothetical protein
MNPHSLKSLTLAGTTGLLLLFANSAQSAVTAVRGDLILGFRAAGGQGASLNLEVNLGAASLYYGAAPGTSFPVTGLNPADLVSTYGAGWASRADLSWGIAGTTGISAVSGVPARTIWASRGETTPGTPSTAWIRGTTAAQQNPSNTIYTLYTGAPGSLSNATQAGSPVSAVVDTNLTGSWTAQEDFLAGVSFQYFNPSVLGDAGEMPATPAIYDGVNGYNVLDLFEVRPSTTSGLSSTLVGAFGLNSSGQIVFSTNPGVFAPVPEPATTFTAAGAIAALLFRRRR